MRMIRFRGKRVDNGEWIDGYLFQSWEKAYICWGMENGEIIKTEVNPHTVGQYTGLKDDNDVEIYEHDILLSGGITKRQVIYLEGEMAFYAHTMKKEEHPQFPLSHWKTWGKGKPSIEVISNIFDDDKN